MYLHFHDGGEKKGKVYQVDGIFNTNNPALTDILSKCLAHM